MSDRVIYLSGEITQESGMSFKKELLDAIEDASVKNIKIYIDSTGGASDSTLSIIDLLLYAKKLGKTIITIANGCCMSGGFFIFLVGDERFTFASTLFMTHTGSYSFEGAEVNSTKKYLIVSDKILDKVIIILLKGTKSR
jgi:ATP-dependent protease ClpP protease subunit